MKKLLFSTILLAALLLAACGESEVGISNAEDITSLPDSAGNQIINGNTGLHKSDSSELSFYFEPDTLFAYFISPSQGDIETGIYLIFRDLDDEGLGVLEGREWSSYTDLERYDAYAQYYGDTVHHDLRLLHHPYEVCSAPLNSISITADRDFDAEHPAGSLLNDLFVFQYASYYNLIQSGFDPDLDINLDYDNDWDTYQLMPLTEFEQIYLMHYKGVLHFTKLPDVLGEYTFTIAFEYGADPVSGKEAKKIAPAVVKAEFTDKDYVYVPVHEPLNKGE